MKLIILLTILILATSGCALFRSQEKPESTKLPTPGVQLWEAAKKSNWLTTISILGIAAGVFALVNGAVKLGTAAIASASVSLFMALAVARFAMWMAVFGLIGSVAAALFSILARRKALVEIIRGVQWYKDDTDNTYDLGDRLETQSKTTKQIVGKLKNEMKLRGEI